jgi:hypothetical protein
VTPIPPPRDGAARIGPDWTVRRILAEHPQTAAVFERHGLMGCGGAAGPDERLDLFASIHRIPLAELVRELEAAAAGPATAAPPAVPGRAGYAPYLRASILCTLTLGAVFGAYNLLVVQLRLGANPPSHNQSHAGFQIWGFAWLFLAGISLHVVPRFLGAELRLGGAARASWAATLAAQALVTWGRLGELIPGALPALAAGSALQLLAVVGWVLPLAATFRAARPKPELFHAYLAAGTLSWLAAALLLAAGAVDALVEADVDEALGWNSAIYTLSLFGGALPWIQGVFLRTGPYFLGLPRVHAPLAVLALAAGQAGALVGAVGALRLKLAWMDAGLLGTALSMILFVLATRPFRAAIGHLSEGDPAFPRLVRLAFAGGLVFSLVGGAYAVAGLSGAGASGVVLDAARHAFTVGFLTLMIVAFAGRILPIFGGVEFRNPRLRAWGGALIAAGALLRQAQVPWALSGEAAWSLVSAVSGPVAAVGVALASIPILRTLSSGPAAAPEGPAQISEDVRICDLLRAHPEALPLLIEAGFTPLANPILRAVVARRVTLRQACGMHGAPLAPLLEKLRRTCPLGGAPGPHPSP